MNPLTRGQSATVARPVYTKAIWLFVSHLKTYQKNTYSATLQQ
jgi:hypothetical protein